MSMQVVRISEPSQQLAMEMRTLFAAAGLEPYVSGAFDLFALFDSRGNVEGAALVEAGDDACILHAVAIRPGSRKKGLGRALVSHILFQCSTAHEKMYLVAHGQQRYFERFGFRVAPRAGIPEEVARSIPLPLRDESAGPVMVIDLPKGAGVF